MMTSYDQFVKRAIQLPAVHDELVIKISKLPAVYRQMLLKLASTFRKFLKLLSNFFLLTSSRNS
jgi:hypothetical protein